MLRFFNKRLHNRKGFTLIELIVVIAILGILALIAIPRFVGIQDSARQRSNQTTEKIVADAAQVAYHNQEPAGSIDAAYLVTNNYLDEAPFYRDSDGNDVAVDVSVTADGNPTVTPALDADGEPVTP